MKYSIYIWYIIIQVWANHPLFVGPPRRLPRHFGTSCTPGLRFATTIITIIMIIIFIWYWRENCQIGEKVDGSAWLGIGNAQRNLIVPVIPIVVSKPDNLSDLFWKGLTINVWVSPKVFHWSWFCGASYFLVMSFHSRPSTMSHLT